MILGQSIWIWKRKQGVCSGRLKPVIDIQVSKSGLLNFTSFSSLH